MNPRNRELIDEFLKYKVEDYGLSPRSYKDYNANLEKFATFIEDKHDGTLETLTPEWIRAYKESLLHLRNDSISTYMSPVKTFCEWLSHPTVSIVTTNPFPKMKLEGNSGGVTKIETHHLTAKEVFNIRASQVISDIAQATIFEVLISSGMRKSEMIELRACDVDFRKRPKDGEYKAASPFCGAMIRNEGYGGGIRIKRGRERKIYISKLAAKLLVTYMKVKRIDPESNAPIFPVHEKSINGWLTRISVKTGLIKEKFREPSLRKRGFLDIDVNSMQGATEGYKKLILAAQERERKEMAAGPSGVRASRVQPPRRVTLHPHSLRHFYTYIMWYRNWYGNRKDLVDLRDLLGHKDITTTDIYLVNEIAHDIIDNDRDWIRVMTGNGLEYRSIFSACQIEIDNQQ